MALWTEWLSCPLPASPHSVDMITCEPVALWTSHLNQQLPGHAHTWAVGPVAGPRLGGRAGVPAGPRPLLVAAAAGDAAEGPWAPVSLAIHVICVRTKMRKEMKKQNSYCPKLLCSGFY